MTFSLSAFIHHFGALGIGLGAGFEGETAVVIGGIIARHGAISPGAAFVAAWLGSMAADQLFFLAGRWRREGAWVHKVTRRRAFVRALAMIDRHPRTFCVVFRFIYGFRTVSPVAIGLSHVPAALFFALNILSAALWAAVFTFVGYHFGRAVEQLLGRTLTPIHVVALALVLLAGAFAVGWWYRRRDRRRIAGT